MGNQLIREQVFDVLFNYVKIADGIYTESDCATVRDEIMLALDQSQFTANEAEEHINQEVEKRIAERMPSEEDVEINLASFDEITNDWFDFTHAVYHWLRSRLTQKTEGGIE